MNEYFEFGLLMGIVLMKEKIRIAAEEGTPIEVAERVYFAKTDIQHLRDMIAEFE